MPNVRRPKDYVDEWRRLWEPDLEAIAYNGATCDPTRVDPKVLQWVKQHCASEPHFIKVINETAAHGWIAPYGARDHGRMQCRLFVPRPFVREHFKELGRVATLENGATHKKWKVSFGVPKKVISWLQGWKRVATENNLTPGDVMIFVLVGHSHFLFHLFDEHGDPKLQRHSNNGAATTVKPEPTAASRSHLVAEHENSLGPTDSEHLFMRSVKQRRLVDLDTPCIVKTEPGVDQHAALEEAPSWSDDDHEHDDEHIRDDAAKVIGSTDCRIGSTLNHDSERTVTDFGEETISRGELGQRRYTAAAPQIALELNNIDTRLAEKRSSSTTRCNATTVQLQSGQEGSDEAGPVKRKLEFLVTTKMKPMKEVMGAIVYNIDTHKKSASTALCTETAFKLHLSGHEGSDEGPVKRKLELLETTKMKPTREEMGGNMVSGHQTVPPVNALPFDPLSFVIKSRRRMPTPIERKRAKEVAKAHAELLLGHRFVVVLTDAQVYRDFHVALPERFVSESKLPTSLTQLKLVDSTGKAWEMYTRMNSCGVVAFHRKFWGLFSLEHFLEEGDVCLLQLKSKDALTMSVRIFRVVQLPKVDGKASVRDHYDMRVKY